MKINIISAIAFILVTANCSYAQKNDNASNNDANNIIANDTCRVIDKYLIQLAADKNFSGGLLIIKNGKTIFCKGYGWANKEAAIPFTPSILASMGSITKAFTAAAIMRLAEDGKLSVSDPLKKFFPNVPADKANITIHQLLTHSSGFHEFLANDGGDYEKIITKEFLEKAFAEPLAFKPGDKAVYTNVGMSILGIIIEQISGIDYEVFLQKYLFEKTGIKNIGYHYPTSKNDTIAHGYQGPIDWGTHQQHFEQAGGGPFWNLKANGGLEVSLNEMAIWANAFTENKMLRKETIAKMFSPQVLEDGTEGRSYFGYGCNISKSRRNTKMIDNGGSNGIYFARLVRLPEEGLVFYMVTNQSLINTNMVLPNITQLYFQGKITKDAQALQPKFETPIAGKIYKIITEQKPADLGEALQKENISVTDDMILLDVGQKLIEEKKADEALVLYQFYTKHFPGIVVAWNDMGDVYLMKSDKPDAKKCYEQALKLRPGNTRATENLNRLNK